MSGLNVFVSLDDSRERLDSAYTEHGLRPNSGRITHASRTLLLAAHHVFGMIPGIKKSQLGLCLSANDAAGESYCGFQNSLVAKDPMPRHYATAVPNAPTSELSLRHRIQGPVVTLAEAVGEASSCPQLLLANDWLSTDVTDHVVIGTLDIDPEGDASRCVLVVLDKHLATQFVVAEKDTPPMPSGIDFLDALATRVGLTKAEVALA